MKEADAQQLRDGGSSAILGLAPRKINALRADAGDDGSL